MASSGFESGTVGNTIATGGAGDPNPWDFVEIDGTSTLKYDRGRIAHGNVAAKIVTGAASPQLTAFGWNVATLGNLTNQYGRFYVALGNNMAGTVLLDIENSGTTVADMVLNSSNQPSMRDTTGTTVLAAGAVGLALNTWYRIEYHIVHSATVGQVEFRAFVGDSQAVFTSGSSAATANTGTQGNEANFGILGNETAFTIWIDDCVAGVADWPGPQPATAAYLPHRMPLGS